MPIAAYLDGQAFAPEVREAMSEAFRQACDVLGFTSPTHPLRSAEPKAEIASDDCEARIAHRRSATSEPVAAVD